MAATRWRRRPIRPAADGGAVEAVSARPCGAEVLGVQWHPEWDVAGSVASQRFFALVGTALRGE